MPAQQVDDSVEIGQHGGTAVSRLGRRGHDVRHHQRDGPGGMGRGDPGIGVLDRNAGRRTRAQPFSRKEVQIRMRLGATDVVASEDGIEAMVDAGKAKVFRGRAA